jgi:hypothetical protein
LEFLVKEDSLVGMFDGEFVACGEEDATCSWGQGAAVFGGLGFCAEVDVHGYRVREGLRRGDTGFCGDCHGVLLVVMTHEKVFWNFFSDRELWEVPGMGWVAN